MSKILKGKKREKKLIKLVTANNSVEIAAEKELNRAAYAQRGFIRLIGRLSSVSVIDIAEFFLERYNCWPKKIIPLINKKESIRIFKILLKDNKVVERIRDF